MRLGAANPTNTVVIPWNLVLRSIVYILNIGLLPALYFFLAAIGLERDLNSSLPLGQVALKFCLLSGQS